jgi:asparagine synthase (glutamine-hydrolysing)
MIYDFDPIFASWQQHFGVDVCCPLLCDEMVDYATHVPARHKYDHSTNRGKLVLRETVKKEPILGDPKRGFGGSPSYFWMNGGQSYCTEYLMDSPRICRDGWINPSWIEKTMSELKMETRTREAQIYKMLGLLAFEVWYRLFVTDEMKEDSQL